MPFKHYTDSCENLASASKGKVDLSCLKKINTEIAKLVDLKESAVFSYMNTDGDLKAIEDAGDAIRRDFEHLVVLGTGGSTLCGQALVGFSSPFARKNPQIHFLDNIDPHTITSLIASLPLKKTCFLVISKSGGTLETISQFLLFYKTLSQEVGTAAAKHFLVITDPSPNILRKTAEGLGIKILDHVAAIGGRFSILTNVGLLPAYVAGINIRALRKGAARAVKELLKPDSSAAKGAALQYAYTQAGYHITVFMPYADQLRPFSYWLRQIWSESLGKNGSGSTPLNASGTLDQHSLLQQFLDGPSDKFYTLFSPPQPAGKDAVIDTSPLKGADFNFINGLSLHSIIDAQYRATLKTLVDKKRPVRSIELEKLDEGTLGELCIQFIAETILVSKLMGINAFDQPAVEQGKVLAKNLLQEAS